MFRAPQTSTSAFLLRLGVIACLVILSLGAGGCRMKKINLKLSPEEYLDFGDSFMARKRYERALVNYLLLYTNYPRDPLAPVGLKRSGDTYYTDKRWEAAHQQYKTFYDYYPRHADVEEVVYRMAESSFKLKLTFDRDKGISYRAIQEYQILLNDYPDGPYTPLSRSRITELRRRLGEFEYYVGRQYYRFGHYNAAALRFERLQREYSDYDQMDKAYFLLGRTYERMLAEDQATDTYQKLLVNYPESRFVSQARKRLDGLKPPASR